MKINLKVGNILDNLTFNSDRWFIALLIVLIPFMIFTVFGIAYLCNFLTMVFLNSEVLIPVFLINKWFIVALYILGMIIVAVSEDRFSIKNILLRAILLPIVALLFMLITGHLDMKSMLLSNELLQVSYTIMFLIGILVSIYYFMPDLVLTDISIKNIIRSSITCIYISLVPIAGVAGSAIRNNYITEYSYVTFALFALGIISIIVFSIKASKLSKKSSTIQSKQKDKSNN